MSGIKLKKLLQTKAPGEQWHSVLAPETVWIWAITNPWEDDFFERKGVTPQTITARERVDTEQEAIGFNRRTPKVLVMGLEVIRGSIKSGQYTRYVFDLTVDSTREFNLAMKELSLEYKITSWDITKIKIWGKGETLVTFQLHNPDGNGTGMFLYKATKDGDTKLYPEIAIGTQMLMVDSFKDTIAQCVCTEELLKSHGCHITYEATKKAMKKKMTGKWLQLN